MVDLKSFLDIVQALDVNGNPWKYLTTVGALVPEITDPLGNVIEIGFDSAGNKTGITDANGHMTNLTYDPRRNMTCITDPLGNKVTLTYDNRNNLTQIKEPPTPSNSQGNIYVYEYDAHDNLTKVTDPTNGITTLSYNSLGQLTSLTDARNNTTTFTYDNSGNRLTANNPDSKLTMTYDGANRLKSVATTGSPNQPGVTINYTYDLNSNRITLSSTPTGTINYVYDALNRITSISNGAGQTVNYSYDTLSRRTQTTFPNGVATDYFYDVKSQLLSLVNRLGATNISTFDYSYDAVGNRSSMDITRTGVSVNSNLSYIYDNLYRLVEATSPLSGQSNEVFFYDAVGNRLRRNGQVMDAVFNMANRLLEDQGFTYFYDSNGNLIEKTDKSTSEVTQYTYDAEDRLIQVSKPGTAAIYRYDTLGRRIEKNVNGTISSLEFKYLNF